ncbi:MAG TPA: phage portal protein [Phycisphaerae bacterium]|nr:phage portal protein [Phycisphaerae bacterium]
MPRRVVRARYDAAQTTDENRRHWAQADHLSVNAANSSAVRRTLRSRARYEVANNSYAKGIVLTLANYVIGTGPRLQLLTDNADLNRRVEASFAAWSKAIGLGEKLRTMRISQVESGEAFGLLVTNGRIVHPVQLDMRLVEADQVASPWPHLPGIDDATDGIALDASGNPASYSVLRRHPGDTGAMGRLEHDTIPAAYVLHLFRPDRPGQVRGIPEITPALPLFAMLRRYTLAVLSAAEQAALPSGVVYTDAPPDPDGAEDSQTPEAMDTFEIDRGEWMTMPAGWKIGQVKAEQPTTVYSDFKHEVLNEIARCLNIPFNIAAGNSSSYNYASGRLDHQAFFKSIDVDWARIEGLILGRLFAAWLAEASFTGGTLASDAKALFDGVPHQWFWDGWEHVDPAKESKAQGERLAQFTTNLATEYGRVGKDWEQELRQRARELALAKELGLSSVAVTQPTEPDADDDEGGEDEDA